MALITCPDCEASISSHAQSCPHCGCPLVEVISSPSPVNVVVRERSTSGFGVAALVLSLIAASICWIPFLGFLGTPVAALGLLFGFIGLIIGLVRGSGIGLSLAGMIVGGGAIAVTVWITGAFATAMGESMDRLSDIENRMNAEQAQ